MPTPSLQGWESYEQQLRTDWERTHPNIPWNDVRLGYRYGWESAHNPLFAGRSWEDAERDLQADWANWQVRQPDRLSWQFQQRWEELLGSIQTGWEQALREAETTTDDRPPTTDH